MSFAAHAAVGHLREPFSDENSLKQWVGDVRARLAARDVTLALVFITPGWFEQSEKLLEIIRVHAQAPLLLGASSTGLIVGVEEAEEDPGIVLALFHLPNADLRPIRFTSEQAEAVGEANDWFGVTKVEPEGCHGFLAFADPFHLNVESWIQQWNKAYPALPIVGGLASGDYSEQRTQVFLNGEVFESGAVAVAFRGNVYLESVISQGCTPFGETWTVTKADGNMIHQIGNRPAYEVLIESFNTLPEVVQQNARGNLFIGLVVNEYLEDFKRGDFLIRNLLGADPASGSLAVAAHVRPGQTLQFQRRDRNAANEDMLETLNAARHRLAGRTIYGGCLCSCNGRGRHLFGRPHHDAALIQKSIGPLGFAGFFCNGELGPIGFKNFVHGYTASAALFVGPPAS